MRSTPNSQTIQRYGLRARKSAAQAVLGRRMLGIPMKFGGDTGAVRTVKVLSDGRRNIGGFYFAGDIFGLEDGNEHALSAEAVVASTVRTIKRRTLVQLAADIPELAQELWPCVKPSRAHHHAAMLVMTAQERVNGFLVEMAERISVGDLVQLPMSRQDIANYLGLTMETVCRAITGLAATSTIYLPCSRTIMLRNRSALEQGMLGTAAM